MKHIQSQKKYSSDSTREQFEPIRELLESARKQTKPRIVDLWEVFNGVVYVLKECCCWRSLPKEYPKCRTVYDYFSKWKKVSLETNKNILEQAFVHILSTIAAYCFRSNKPSFKEFFLLP